MLLMAVLLGDIARSRAGIDARYVSNLVHWRAQFSTVLVEPSRDLGYSSAYCESLGGAHSMALYPLGSASERYVISVWEGGASGPLMYEKRHGSRAKVDLHAFWADETYRRFKTYEPGGPYTKSDLAICMSANR